MALAIAHRGASTRFPENTMRAFRAAIRRGCDVVEADVQLSCDGVPVLIHDLTLGRTTDAERVYPSRAPWHVGDFTWAELRRLDAGAWKGPAFAGEQIPSLEQLLRLAYRQGVGVLLDVKSPHLYPGIGPILARELAAVPAMAGRVEVQSFDIEWAQRMKVCCPGVRLGVLGQPDPADLPELRGWASFVNPHYRGLESGFVGAAQEVGLSVLTWTVDRHDEIAAMLDLGVDGIVTNRPARLRQLLDQLR